MAHLHFIILSLIIISTAAIQSNFHRTESCSKAQGYCVLEKECPHSVDDKYKNLCEEQKTEGAICCKDFPVDDVNCYQLHNDCRKTCPESLTLGQKGCPAGKVCCVLV